MIRSRLGTRLAALCVCVLASGCASLLPDSKKEVVSDWNSCEQAVVSLAALQPYSTTRGDVHSKGLDPGLNPTIIVMHFGDALQRFASAAQIKPEDVDRGIRHCLSAGKQCNAFIAGSYMPFLLGALRGAWGWSLFAVVWAAAAVGVGAKLLDRLKHKGWSTGLYVAMGWVAVIAAVPLVERLPPEALAWLVAGGIAYSVGAVVYLSSARLRYAHFIWHLFVIAGGSCHFLAAIEAVGA